MNSLAERLPVSHIKCHLKRAINRHPTDARAAPFNGEKPDAHPRPESRTPAQCSLLSGLLRFIRISRPPASGPSRIVPFSCASIASDKGNALSPVYFGHLMASAIEDAGLPPDCVLHGLRKTAGRLLAEAGAQVAPITGHRTERMTAEYSRDANQKKLAEASVLKWGKLSKRNKARR